LNGSTHGGAYVSGTATVPREVSQFGPHLIESLLAAEKTTGPLPPPDGFGGAGVVVGTAEQQPDQTATTIPTNGA
jgi:hypothetical protein